MELVVREEDLFPEPWPSRWLAFMYEAHPKPQRRLRLPYKQSFSPLDQLALLNLSLNLFFVKTSKRMTSLTNNKYNLVRLQVDTN